MSIMDQIVVQGEVGAINLSENFGIDLRFDTNEFFKNTQTYLQMSYRDIGIKYIYDENNEGKVVGIKFIVDFLPFYLALPTKTKLQLPPNVHAIVYSRSGLFFKNGIEVFNGVIDASYRGTVVVGLKFWKPGIFSFMDNDRIAQLILFSNKSLNSYQIVFGDVDPQSSNRGERGFGSSGLQ